MTTPMEHAKLAVDNNSGLYLTSGEAYTLVTYITLLESEEKNLREANHDYAEQHAFQYAALEQARLSYDRLHAYTRGALAAYARDRLRLIAERDQAIYGANVWKNEADETRLELEGLRDHLADIGW